MPKKPIEKIAKSVQNREPNFIRGGKNYLVRCFKCEKWYGKENYLPAVASGTCAWCGDKWEDKK